MTLRLASLAQGRTLRLASASALRATADKSLAQGWARRIVVAIWTAAFVAIVGGSSVFACPVCFAAEETSMVNGTRIGILVLLAVTLVVQGAFVGFFLYLRNRAKQIADIELDSEWSELQRASR
jgi:hypothetical protein